MAFEVMEKIPASWVDYGQKNKNPRPRRFLILRLCVINCNVEVDSSFRTDRCHYMLKFGTNK